MLTPDTVTSALCAHSLDISALCTRLHLLTGQGAPVTSTQRAVLSISNSTRNGEEYVHSSVCVGNHITLCRHICKPTANAVDYLMQIPLPAQDNMTIELDTTTDYTFTAFDAAGVPLPLVSAARCFTVNSAVRRVHLANRVDAHTVYTLLLNFEVGRGDAMRNVAASDVDVVRELRSDIARSAGSLGATLASIALGRVRVDCTADRPCIVTAEELDRNLQAIGCGMASITHDTDACLQMIQVSEKSAVLKMFGDPSVFKLSESTVLHFEPSTVARMTECLRRVTVSTQSLADAVGLLRRSVLHNAGDALEYFAQRGLLSSEHVHDFARSVDTLTRARHAIIDHIAHSDSNRSEFHNGTAVRARYLVLNCIDAVVARHIHAICGIAQPRYVEMQCYPFQLRQIRASGVDTHNAFDEVSYNMALDLMTEAIGLSNVDRFGTASPGDAARLTGHILKESLATCIAGKHLRMADGINYVYSAKYNRRLDATGVYESNFLLAEIKTDGAVGAFVDMICSDAHNRIIPKILHNFIIQTVVNAPSNGLFNTDPAYRNTLDRIVAIFDNDIRPLARHAILREALPDNATAYRKDVRIRTGYDEAVKGIMILDLLTSAAPGKKKNVPGAGTAQHI